MGLKSLKIDGGKEAEAAILQAIKLTRAKGGADQPATALDSKSEGDKKPKLESEGCPR